MLQVRRLRYPEVWLFVIVISMSPWQPMFTQVAFLLRKSANAACNKNALLPSRLKSDVLHLFQRNVFFACCLISNSGSLMCSAVIILILFYRFEFTSCLLVNCCFPVLFCCGYFTFVPGVD